MPVPVAARRPSKGLDPSAPGPRAHIVKALQDIPNIGPSVAADLRRVGIDHPAQLTGQDPFRLYRKLCDVTAERQDPCVLDTFISAVRFMEGAPARPWWHYTGERKRKYGHLLRVEGRGQN
jgi:hypothetical protein